jgi:hypothetical protein
MCASGTSLHLVQYKRMSAFGGKSGNRADTLNDDQLPLAIPDENSVGESAGCCPFDATQPFAGEMLPIDSARPPCRLRAVLDNVA